MDQDHIDSLFERYLALLDEYTRLRADLSRLQSDVFRNLARANFQADRGMRFGPDYYDGRMKAERKVDIDRDSLDPEWIKYAVLAEADIDGEQLHYDDEDDDDHAEKTTEPAVMKVGEGNDTKEDESESKEEKPGQKRLTSKNPLRWFGLFTPPSLAKAQSSSIQAIEETIPRILTVKSELLFVEIDIRRARKKRAKAEASGQKDMLGTKRGKEITA